MVREQCLSEYGPLYHSVSNTFSVSEEILFSENYDRTGVTQSWLSVEVRDYLGKYKNS